MMLWILLELKNIPDLGKAVQNGELSLLDIYKIRETKNSIKFRNWLKKSDKTRGKRSCKALYCIVREQIFDSVFTFKGIEVCSYSYC